MKPRTIHNRGEVINAVAVASLDQDGQADTVLANASGLVADLSSYVVGLDANLQPPAARVASITPIIALPGQPVTSRTVTFGATNQAVAERLVATSATALSDIARQATSHNLSRGIPPSGVVGGVVVYVSESERTLTPTVYMTNEFMERTEDTVGTRVSRINAGLSRLRRNSTDPSPRQLDRDRFVHATALGKLGTLASMINQAEVLSHIAVPNPFEPKH